MTHPRHIPTALSVVSYVFFIFGVLAFVGIFVKATMGSLALDFNILGFWIWAGLRRYSPGWRTFALALIWLTMIGCIIGFVFGFVGHGPAFFELFGKRYTYSSLIWVSVFSALYFATAFWMYRVLIRPDIRALFYVGPQAQAA